MSRNIDPVKLAAYVAARSVEDGDCIRWTGFLYGGQPGANIDGQKFCVPRALWEIERGPIPGLRLRCMCGLNRCINLNHRKPVTPKELAKMSGALGLMSGPVRSAKIAATKRAGKQAKVSDEVVQAIRESDEPGIVLARRYGISNALVSKYRLYQVRKDYSANPFAGLLEAVT